MNDKPEALRLADALENTPNWQKESFGSEWKSGTMTFDRTPFEAAAELRRLHAENEALKAELAEQARLNGMGSEREARLMAVMAELVEALKHAAECVQTNYLPDKCGRDWDEVIARASK